MIDLSLGPPTQETLQRIIVFEVNSNDDDNWPPETIQYFIEWLNSLLEKIPKRHQKSATIDFHGEQICISYYRTETQKEFDARMVEYDEAVEHEFGERYVR